MWHFYSVLRKHQSRWWVSKWTTVNKGKTSIIWVHKEQKKLQFKLNFYLLALFNVRIKSAAPDNSYLPIFIYELATDMNTLKFETENLSEKESLIRLCRRDFVLFIYACIFSTSFVRQKQHNFNTNLFMFWCCKMSPPINLWAFLKLQSTSLVAFFVSAKVGSPIQYCNIWDYVCYSKQTQTPAPCTSIYT